jgi:glycosyltransferase involved in cell wall biosynthesis
MATLTPGGYGGVAQSVAGTVAGLGQLDDGSEEYTVITSHGCSDWLADFIGPNTTVLVKSQIDNRDVFTRLLSRGAPSRIARRVTPRKLLKHSSSWHITGYDPVVERLNPDVVHFPFQWFHLTSAPSMFNPQDIQYVHHPENFGSEVAARRNEAYMAWCRACTVVEVPSESSKTDVVTHLRVTPGKVAVVPKAPFTQVGIFADEIDPAELKARYALPDVFAFYPAQTFPHKNHLRLLEALARLRDQRATTLPLICTGYENEFSAIIRNKVIELDLSRQVQFLGYVPDGVVRGLYRCAALTVFPSTFEGWGFPALEALAEGSPLACSRIDPLETTARDAALYFDPTDSEDIALTLLRLLTDEPLSARLRARGLAVAQNYSWDRTARICRALYRSMAGRTLSQHDQELVASALGSRRAPTAYSGPIAEDD